MTKWIVSFNAMGHRFDSDPLDNAQMVEYAESLVHDGITPTYRLHREEN